MTFRDTPDGYGLYVYICGICRGNGCPYCDLTGEPKCCREGTCDPLSHKQPTPEQILEHYKS